MYITSASTMRHLPAHYIKGKFIGKGGFARCYELTNSETKEVFAVKIVAKSSIVKPRAQAKLKSEIAIHRSLSHEKVVRFYDYYEDSEYVYIILEYCPNQTLNEFLRKRQSRRMAEPEAMFYIYDLILALKYLHKNRILHRDLKLGNLFLDYQMRIKIGDFGLAAQLETEDEKRRTICGTPNYIAPEILDGKNGHSYEVDVWSLGVILYTMLIGKPPFETSDVKATYRKIRYNEYSFPEDVAISEHAKVLIQTLLQTDPRARPQLDEVMHSKWMQISRLPPPVPLGIESMRVSKMRGPTAAMPGQAPSVSTTVGSNTHHGAPSSGGAPGAYYGGDQIDRRGAASSRSETPDRALDFARLDSPCPRSRGAFNGQMGAERYPMRERSPSIFTSPSRGGPPLNDHNLKQTRAHHGLHHQHQQAHHQQMQGHPALPPPNANGRPPLYNQTPSEGQENIYPGGAGASTSGVPLVHPHQHHGVASSAHHGSHGHVVTSSAAAHPHAQHNGGHSYGHTSAGGHHHGAGNYINDDPAYRYAPPAQVVHYGNGGYDPAGRTGSGASASNAHPYHPSHSSSYAGGAASNYAGSTASTAATHQNHHQNVGGSHSHSHHANSYGAGTHHGGTAGGATSSRGGPLVRPSSARPPLRGSGYSGGSSTGRLDLHQTGNSTGGMVGGDSMRGRAGSGERRPMSARCVQLPDRGRPGPLSSARGALDGDHQQRVSSAVSNVRTPLAEKRRDDAHFASPAVFLDALGYRFSPNSTTAKEKPTSAFNKPDLANKPLDETLPELWVTKWVDYSSKYGIGYVFSDSSIGVYFNDSTKIILESPSGVGFEYITRRTMDRPEQRSRHTLEDYPEDLRKKVTLLKHFKNYLLISGHSERKDNSQATLGESGLVANNAYVLDQNQKPNTERPYVKKWMKNRHAIMFQLSNKIVQVIFFDKTEVVLSSKTHTVTYIDKRGQRSAYPLQSVMEISNTELAKRLRYTKDILVNLLSGTRSQQRGETGSVVGS